MILVTGAAGFIGFHLCLKLLESGTPVLGIDNLNDYYDPSLKSARIKLLEEISAQNSTQFVFEKIDLIDVQSLIPLFKEYAISCVVNLAAQAGVRYSIENPSAYIQSNLVGFSNLIECARRNNISNFIYASSSSVYGGNEMLPFSEEHSVDHPVSLYAATKKSNELIAHSYSHLYGLPTTGLRFFTVYGPWGRPDMALFLFTKAMINGQPINLFNGGDMIRDFTYIDDIIDSVYRLISKPALPDSSFDRSMPNSSSSWAPYRVFNIGNSNPVPLMKYVHALERSLGVVSEKNYLPMQNGDVRSTSADTSLLESWINFKPTTSVDEGVAKFVSWYRTYYNV